MIPRSELYLGYRCRWTPIGRPDVAVPVTVVGFEGPVVKVEFSDGSRTNAVPTELHRVAARRAITLKDIAKAYGGNKAVDELDRLIRKKA